MLEIAICDDQSLYREQLINDIKEWSDYGKEDMRIQSFKTGNELLFVIEESGPFDLIFLDVEMPGEDGIKTAERIREKDYSTAIIFVSQYETYYRDAFEVQPFHFLDKPVNKEKLFQVLNRYQVVHARINQCYTFRGNRKRYSVPLNEILYFYSERRNIHMVCKEQEYIFYDKLDHVQDEINLKTNKFVRIHQSFMVNEEAIRLFQYKSVVMQNEVEIPIAQDRRKTLNELHMMRLRREDI